MTVLLRVKRSQSSHPGSRRREQRDQGSHARAVAGASAAVAATPATQRADRERTPPAPQDRALYTCGCGFVFSQDVSTSVACPHCGDTQAW